MKHKIFSIIGAALLLLAFGSCREESDALMSYDHNDYLVFSEANSSFAKKFEVLWNGLNQQYSLWDYESEQGLDWDAVYDEYMPQFEALDQRKDVTDDELKELVLKVVGPLHDGHMVVEVHNHQTGNFVYASPSYARNQSRSDFMLAQKYKPTINYYAKKENGEIMLDQYGNPDCMEHTTIVNELLNRFKNTKGMGLQWVKDSLAVLQQLTTPTAQQVDIEYSLLDIVSKLENVEATSSGLQLYNEMFKTYKRLKIPGFTPIDERFLDDGLSLKYALLKGNIAYLYLSAFSLMPYLDVSYSDNNFAGADEYTREHIMEMRKVWSSWFETIQRLHKSGQLGGVIIDVRGNGGGFSDDFKRVMGALLPSGGFDLCNVRFKRGTARLDYSPLMPFVVPTMEEEHVTVTEPIVVLANCKSVSMAEITSLSAKEIDNARLVGKRTWGGLCGLMDNLVFTFNYSGHIGVDGETPVYVYLPLLATFTHDGQQLEGVGVTPDIEVDLDVNLLTTTGKDTQLDRALQYIRTGN